MRTEIWKYVEDTYGKVKVSNFGRVVHFSKGEWKDCYARTKTNGYFYVAFKQNGRTKEHRLHIVVAKAFLPNPNKYSEVNHIDEDKANNSVFNLEWCNRQQNQKHSEKNRIAQQRIAQHDKKKFILVRSDGKRFNSFAKAGISVGRSRSTIKNCLDGYCHTCGGYGWKRVSVDELTKMRQLEIEF